jgi:hypothetical protein
MLADIAALEDFLDYLGGCLEEWEEMQASVVCVGRNLFLRLL